MEKVDFRRLGRPLYAPPTEFVEIDVPPMSFLMIDGHGDPNISADYTAAVEALYAASYAVKFASKRQLERDHVVPPLEGLWWSEDDSTFAALSKSDWSWRMMIRQPDWVVDLIEEALTLAVKKARAATALRFESFDEGRSVQILHVGSYDDEAPTIARLHLEYLPGHGLVENGVHHEVYLSDPRRTDAAKLRTVLRQPVRTA